VTAACSFLALGWFFNLVPYVAVRRQAFVYHYMPALVFAQLLVTVLVEGVVPPSWHRVLVPVVLLVTLPAAQSHALHATGSAVVSAALVSCCAPRRHTRLH
jgi:dolichyl-phosphate-mannose--protein O-mannosyl transferase